MGRVIVVGSINMDLVASVDRFPRAGETILGRTFAQHPGGKGANQAVAAARAGASTQIVAALGEDEHGRQMREFLVASGVGCANVRSRATTPTGTALITVCAGENSIVVVPGANATLRAGDLSDVAIAPGEVLVAQLEIPIATVAAAMQRGQRLGAVTVLNAAPMLDAAKVLLRHAHVLIVNEIELTALSGMPIDAHTAPHQIAQAADSLRERGLPTIIATLGARGAIVVGESAWFEIPGRHVEVVDTTGAGDCFIGAFAAALADGRSLRSAAAFANTAASICVQRPGAGPSMPTRTEIDAAQTG